jgi:MFS family permease
MSASLTSGRLISKFGRYRVFPIFGTAMLIFSFWLFSHIAVDTNRVLLGVWMLLLGLGVGSVMPVLTLAVQNAVDRKQLGTATSSVVFFRSIGSALGAAIFGTILANRLSLHLTQAIPDGHGAKIAEGLHQNVAGLAQLPPQIVHTVLIAFSRSFHDVFLFGIPFAIAAFVMALLLKETPLRTSARDEAKGEGLEL